MYPTAVSAASVTSGTQGDLPVRHQRPSASERLALLLQQVPGACLCQVHPSVVALIQASLAGAGTDWSLLGQEPGNPR